MKDNFASLLDDLVWLEWLELHIMTGKDILHNTM